MSGSFRERLKLFEWAMVGAVRNWDWPVEFVGQAWGLVVQVRQLHTLPGIVVLGLDIAITGESLAVVEGARQVGRQFTWLGLVVQGLMVVVVVVVRMVFHGASCL